MSLIQQIQADHKSARLARNDKVKISLLTTVLSRANDDAKKALRDINDGDVMSAIKYYNKGAVDTMELMVKSGMTNDARYVQAEQEILILAEYLPKKLSAERLEQAIAEILATTPGAKAGPVIGALKKQHGDAVDAKMANEIIARLSAG